MSILNNLYIFNDDVTDPRYGYDPEERPINVLLDYGLILIDKPPGPPSHEVIAWIKQILKIKKAGHSGTLDPGTTGLLPVGLGEATKALSVLLLGPKEYYALARIHEEKNYEDLKKIFEQFMGDIYQRPPQRSSVRRATRIRKIHEIELVEKNRNTILLRLLCEAGTYVRKLIYDAGEILGCGATMFELRRTRVTNFSENAEKFVRLHELVDAFQTYLETNNDKKLRSQIKPVESCLGIIGKVVIKDSAVNAICHGAPVALPGISAVSKDLKSGDLVGVYTLKGEIVSLGQSTMSFDEMNENKKGISVLTKRLIMKPDTYPKLWHTKEECHELKGTT